MLEGNLFACREPNEMKITKRDLEDEKILFYGAGTAGIGIANLYVTALTKKGYSKEEARRSCWFVDSKGLVVSSRKNLSQDKLPFAHEY